ncbi:hypothetical protein SISSUDRAFT_593431 [Sistotremastrum suecicum HHB10207 ss-3]|uniref:Uncharacterized protein n=1 Tax=Sistotremastrum suecicum HHB10207 ss-3 TaxID=1314776 RepID=A0A165XBB9_9AGAM|nr:hypothetical protein SISSUDRAFT_593431 [Sistotremastrum suecicum HHB10207 ss-3]
MLIMVDIMAIDSFSVSCLLTFFEYLARLSVLQLILIKTSWNSQEPAPLIHRSDVTRCAATVSRLCPCYSESYALIADMLIELVAIIVFFANDGVRNCLKVRFWHLTRAM